MNEANYVCGHPSEGIAPREGRPPLVLQDRDPAFLQAVADYRLLSTPQHFLLFPDS